MKKEKLFEGKKVTIMGLGLHGGGVGVAKFFYKQGAEVLVTDLKTKEQLEKSLKKLKKLRITYRLGEHKEEDFINTNLIVKNPAVPRSSRYLELAKEHNIPIATDVDVFFDLCKVPIIGVTGTKGKSTTATLIYEILKTQFKNTILAGNIGVSPLEFLDKLNEKSKVVLELSSFELEDLRKSPQIAVITAMYPDHLDRYDSYEEYIESKEPIFLHQRPTDFLILNYDNFQTKNYARKAKSNIYFFSNYFYLKRETDKLGCFIEDENVFFGKETEPIFNVNNIKLSGEHNVSNLMAAVTVAKILQLPNDKIKRVISKFQGVANREQFVAEKKGVRYINDTTATMPDATIKALKTMKEDYPQSRIILIIGGQDKRLEYANLAKEIVNKVQELVFLPGTASEKIKTELRNINSKIRITLAESMKEAVKTASSLADKEDIVLLSPAAASFNIFKNEFDRGDQFVKAVKKL